MHGAISKYGPLGKLIESQSDEEPYVVSIMPCTAKKDESQRPGVRGDIDAVLTTRELAKMIRHRKIPFASLSNDGEYDNPCLLYTSPSPRDMRRSRMPSSA